MNTPAITERLSFIKHSRVVNVLKIFLLEFRQSEIPTEIEVGNILPKTLKSYQLALNIGKITAGITLKFVSNKGCWSEFEAVEIFS